jgi:hypothetical protein
MRSKGKSKRRFMRQRGGVSWETLNCDNYQKLYNNSISDKEAGMFIAIANLCGNSDFAKAVYKNHPNATTYNTAN